MQKLDEACQNSHTSGMKLSAKIFRLVFPIILLVLTFPLLLAGCVPDVEQLEQAQDVKGLIKALTYNDPKVSDAAAKALIKIGEPAVPLLIDLFRDGNSAEMEKAGMVLKEIGKPALIPLMNRFYSFSLRMTKEIADIFEGAGDPSIDSLIAYVNTSHSSYAIAVLGEIGSARATQSIIECLNNYTVAPEIEIAVEALGKIGDSAAVIPIISKIGRNIETNKIIFDALNKIGEPSIAILIKTIEDNNSNLHEKAAWAFVKMREGSARELFKYLEDKETVWVYKLLIRVGNSESEALLIRALEDFATEEMAKDYMNSGNPNLKGAAIRWATAHNYLIYNTPGVSKKGSQANWGGGLGEAP